NNQSEEIIVAAIEKKIMTTTSSQTKKIIIILVVFLVGGLLGRMSKQTPTKVEIKEVERIVYRESKDIKKTIKREKHPDGSVTETIVIEDKTQVGQDTIKSKESTTKYARTIFYGGIGTQLDRFSDVQYSAGVIRDQVIGDFSV